MTPPYRFLKWRARLESRPPNLDSGRLTPYGMGWLAEFAGRGPLKDKWYVFAFGPRLTVGDVRRKAGRQPA